MPRAGRAIAIPAIPPPVTCPERGENRSMEQAVVREAKRREVCGRLLFLAGAVIFGMGFRGAGLPFAGRSAMERDGALVNLGAILAASLIALLGLLAVRIASKIGLMFVAMTYGLIVACLALPWLLDPGVQTTRTRISLEGPAVVETKIHEYHWLKMVLEGHERYGSVAVANTTGNERVEPEFDVHYTIGPDHWRVVPDLRPEVAVLGCSFTFGVGVEDKESYPAVLNNRFWRDHKVRNYSLMGYGTRQACLILEDRLRLEPPPVAVFYGWIYDHIRRNYLGVNYHGAMSPDGTFPFFEIVDGDAVFQGPRANRLARMSPDDPETFQKETAVTIALVRKMDRMCRDRRIPFFFVLLGQKYPLADDPVAAFVKASEIEYLDLRHLKEGFFENDPHPKREWHAATAEAIANDPRLAFLKPCSPSLK